MIEARITCLCPNIILADLGLKMTKGQIVYLEEGLAKGSADMVRAARASGIHVQYVQRAREVKKPSIANPRRGPIVVGSPTPTTIQPPVEDDLALSSPGVDVSEAIRAQMDPLHRKIDNLHQVVVQAIASGGVVVGRNVPDNHQGEGIFHEAPSPRFIPSGLVKDTKADFTIESEDGANADLEGAVAALKARRKMRGQ